MTNLGAKARVAKEAEPQFGRITWAQLQKLAVPKSTVAVWIADAYLFHELPRVYAVGSRARTTESDLAAALLYAGPGAALSHATAAWGLGLLDRKPPQIHISTPRRCSSLRSKGIKVHDRRPRDRSLHRGLPTTTVAQILLDLAATEPPYLVRLAMANAEHAELLDLSAVKQVLRRGSPGSATLRRAAREHEPRLAETKSRLERRLLGICKAEDFPLPDMNQKVAGWEVDALWLDAKLAVELDGYSNHHTRAQLRRDRRKEMALRGAGLTPIRYSEDQLIERTEVAAELRVSLTPVLRP